MITNLGMCDNQYGIKSVTFLQFYLKLNNLFVR